MEQSILESKELRNDFLTTFAFIKKPDGLEISIVGCMELLPAPNTAGGVVGVIHLRGKVIPIVDLRMKFGLGSTKIDDSTCILLAEDEHEEEEKQYNVGIIVSDISDIIAIASETLVHSENDVGYDEFGSEDNNRRGLAKVLMNIEYIIDGIEFDSFE